MDAPWYELNVNEQHRSLTDAIIATVGKGRFDALGGEENLVAVHEFACLHAFRVAASRTETESLRTALDYLRRNGRYSFYAPHRSSSPGS